MIFVDIKNMKRASLGSKRHKQVFPAQFGAPTQPILNVKYKNMSCFLQILKNMGPKGHRPLGPILCIS